MTGNQNLFSTYVPCDKAISVTIADGSRSYVVGIGTVHISKTLKLDSVFYIPQLTCNLLSVRKLNKDLKCLTLFNDHSCCFQYLVSGKMIGNDELCVGLYLLKSDFSSSPQCWLASVSNLQNKYVSDNILCFKSNKDNDIMLHHYRLRHPNFMYLERMFPSLFLNKNAKSFQCDICHLSKHTRTTYLPRPYKSSSHFSMIHSDIWGASRVSSVNEARWFLLFVDDHTRLSWVFLMKEKSETIQLFKQFHVMIQNQFNTNIQIFHSDMQENIIILSLVIISNLMVLFILAPASKLHNKMALLNGKIDISSKWLDLLCSHQMFQNTSGGKLCSLPPT